jgi:hypothetical protein
MTSINMIMALNTPKSTIGSKLARISTPKPIQRMNEEERRARPLLKIMSSTA